MIGGALFVLFDAGYVMVCVVSVLVLVFVLMVNLLVGLGHQQAASSN